MTHEHNNNEISQNDVNFRRFRLGLSIFFTGMVFLYASNQLLEPSLSQELVSLACIAIISGGFILAIVSEVRFVLSRIIRFFNSK